ncbi:hypothetical protein FQA39_LY02580 [Lamprigera yunnana]|nr:hypothetical protein FQA39_LY02580 [Lamprigera yunnana]
MRGFAEAPLRQTKIPFHLRVLASLNFFATGTYQTRIGQDLNLAMSQSSISKSVTEVSEIFCNHLLRYVKFPVNEVCDADMCFLNVNARYPGVTHNVAIWEVSTIHRGNVLDTVVQATGVSKSTVIHILKQGGAIECGEKITFANATPTPKLSPKSSVDNW